MDIETYLDMPVAANWYFRTQRPMCVVECSIARHRVAVVPLVAGVSMAYVKEADLSDINTSVEITDAVTGSRNSAYIDMLARMGVV